MNEIDTLPANYIDEILRYVKSLKKQESAKNNEYADTAVVQEIGEGIVQRHLHAFKELAK